MFGKSWSPSVQSKCKQWRTRIVWREKKKQYRNLSHLKGQLGKSRRNKGREKVRTEGQTDRQTDGEAGVGFLGGAHILTEGTDRA